MTYRTQHARIDDIEIEQRIMFSQTRIETKEVACFSHDMMCTRRYRLGLVRWRKSVLSQYIPGYLVPQGISLSHNSPHYCRPELPFSLACKSGYYSPSRLNLLPPKVCNGIVWICIIREWVCLWDIASHTVCRTWKLAVYRIWLCISRSGRHEPFAQHVASPRIYLTVFRWNLEGNRCIRTTFAPAVCLGSRPHVDRLTTPHQILCRIIDPCNVTLASSRREGGLKPCAL